MPAPSRYTIARSGGPVNEEDIVDSSNWIQPDEREAMPEYCPLGPPPGGWPEAASWFYSFDEKLTEPPYDNRYLEWVSDAAVTMLSTDTDGPVTDARLGGIPTGTAAFYGHYVIGGIGPPTGTYYQTQGAAKCVQLLDNRAWVLQPLRSCWHESWLDLDWPDEAIGYEVEQAEVQPDLWLPISTPMSVRIQGTIGGMVTEGFIGGTEVRLQAQRSWRSQGDLDYVDSIDFGGYVVVDQSSSYGPNSRLISETYQEPIADVVGIVPPDGTPMESVNVDMTISEFAPEHPFLAMFSLWISLRNGMVISGESVRVEATQNVAPTAYTIRPPRIRWLYDVEVSGPAVQGDQYQVRRRFVR